MSAPGQSRFSRGTLPGSPAQRIAEALASVPVAPDERYFHQDLLHATPEGDLHFELLQLRTSLLMWPRSHWWVFERVKRIEAELRHRHAG
jgi:hypothetical protein